ncbi:UNVERIFIED_CONTAM: hypothetical protein K2H54_037193 [Gekko kuhli]
MWGKHFGKREPVYYGTEGRAEQVKLQLHAFHHDRDVHDRQDLWISTWWPSMHTYGFSLPPFSLQLKEKLLPYRNFANKRYCMIQEEGVYIWLDPYEFLYPLS